MKAKIKNPTQKLVLLKLADCASDTGECFPSYQHISDQCGISRRAVINIIKKLQADGFLHTEKRCYGNCNKSNIYTLTIEKGNQVVNEIHHTSEQHSLGGSEQHSLGSEQHSLGGGERRSPITSNYFESVSEPRESTHKTLETQNANFENANNSQNENCADKNFSYDFADQKTETRKSVSENPNELKNTAKKSKHETELQILAEIGVTGQIAEDHLAIRKAKRVPITPTAAQQMAKDAAACGLTAIQAIEIAIGYGWASFRADWFCERQNGFSGSLKNNTAQPKNRINQIPHHPEGLQNVFLAKDIF